jgi:hypothetical protein
VDTSECGGKALQFRLKATGRSGAVLTPTAKLSSAGSATLSLPFAARKGAWIVQLIDGGAVVSSVTLK